eukprot:gene337-188_t
MGGSATAVVQNQRQPASESLLAHRGALATGNVVLVVVVFLRRHFTDVHSIFHVCLHKFLKRNSNNGCMMDNATAEIVFECVKKLKRRNEENF